MSAITLKNVSKNYGDVAAVHGINLQIDKGDFVVILGPSGCGKTTTLRMVAGLEDISGGEITIGNQVVNDLAPKERGVAMVFQNYALYPHMTVQQNMEFALRPLKLSTDEVANRIAKTSKILGLSELLARKPAQLSGGQRQRVAMGRAMVRTPAVFLFDEPLSNLDAKLRTQVRWQIGKLHQRLGTTVLYVTHDQVEAMTLADKIVVMRDGRIEQIGTPEEVYMYPTTTFVATFIDSPSMNMIDGIIKNHQIEAEGISFAIPDSFYGQVKERQEVTLGIRPIDINLVAKNKKNALPATVGVTEYLGNESLLELRVSDYELVAQMHAECRTPIGSEVFITLDLNKVHLFDKISGQSLRPK